MKRFCVFLILINFTTISNVDAGVIGVISREISQGISNFISRLFNNSPNKIEFYVFDRFRSRLKREEIPCPPNYLKSRKIVKTVFIRSQPKKNASLIGEFVKGEKFCFKQQSDEWSRSLFGWVENNDFKKEIEVD